MIKLYSRLHYHGDDAIEGVGQATSMKCLAVYSQCLFGRRHCGYTQ